jgi:2-isopropylmalate synthase
MAGVQAGARQVECAVNGIGERAGNASIEELIMLFHTRRDELGFTTGAVTTEIARTSRLVSRLTGYPVQPNKAIVGRNAFSHESGIHQDGVLKERTTFEIMDARSIGLEGNDLVLGKHSGRAALKQTLADMGYSLDGAALNHAFKRFKEVADRKKQVTAMDLEALVTDELRDEVAAYSVEWFDVEASTRRPPHATIAVRTPEGEVVQASFTGDGPVDAIFRAINSATGIDARLREYRIDAVTGGQDALGETSVVVELGSPADAIRADIPGVLAGARVTGAGQAVATDVLASSATAYVRALSDAVRKARAAAGSPPATDLAATP